MKVTQLEKNLLKDLFRASNGLLAYTMYSKYRLSPSDLFKFIHKFTSEEIIKQRGDRLFISEKGKAFLMFERRFVSSNKGKYYNIPPDFIGPRIKVNEFYVPNIHKLPKEILDLQSNKGGGLKS